MMHPQQPSTASAASDEQQQQQLRLLMQLLGATNQNMTVPLQSVPHPQHHHHPPAHPLQSAIAQLPSTSTSIGAGAGMLVPGLVHPLPPSSTIVSVNSDALQALLSVALGTNQQQQQHHHHHHPQPQQQQQHHPNLSLQQQLLLIQQQQQQQQLQLPSTLQFQQLLLANQRQRAAVLDPSAIPIELVTTSIPPTIPTSRLQPPLPLPVAQQTAAAQRAEQLESGSNALTSVSFLRRRHDTDDAQKRMTVERAKRGRRSPTVTQFDNSLKMEVRLPAKRNDPRFQPKMDAPKTDHMKNRVFRCSTEEVLVRLTENAYIANLHQAFSVRLQFMAQCAIRSLTEFGWALIDSLLGDRQVQQLYAEVEDLYRRGYFAPGRLSDDTNEGGSGCSSVPGDVRSDMAYWWDASAGGDSSRAVTLRLLVNVLDTIVAQFASRTPYRIAGRSKAMVAMYPARGTRYLRHVDNPCRDGRALTAIYYCNEDWKEEHGGRLVLYPRSAEQPIAVDPRSDRLLLFWSDLRNPHEVQPVHRDRFAVTVWYFDQDEREDWLEGKQREAGMDVQQQQQDGDARQVEDMTPLPPVRQQQRDVVMTSDQRRAATPVTKTSPLLDDSGYGQSTASDTVAALPPAALSVQSAPIVGPSSLVVQRLVEQLLNEQRERNMLPTMSLPPMPISATVPFGQLHAQSSHALQSFLQGVASQQQRQQQAAESSGATKAAAATTTTTMAGGAATEGSSSGSRSMVTADDASVLASLNATHQELVRATRPPQDGVPSTGATPTPSSTLGPFVPVRSTLPLQPVLRDGADESVDIEPHSDGIEYHI